MNVDPNQRNNLIILAISQFFCLSLWFSTNAVISEISILWNLGSDDLAILSGVVVAGFVIGGLVSSILNVSDIFDSSRVFFVSALLGGITNSLITIVTPFSQVIVLRFLTGFFIAGIYPVGMKLTASHFKDNRGLAIGILLSALTAGSGLPYIFNLTGTPNWRLLVNISSLLSVLGGILVLVFTSEGPFVGKSAKFSIDNVRTIYQKSSVRLANLGYFGHMWELYAFWVWIPVFLAYSYQITYPSRDPLIFVSAGTFAIFAVGAVSNIVGGSLSDKFGRSTFNIAALALSGLSSLLIGFFVNSPGVALIIALIWGLSIIPDSPQYSAMVTELSDQSLVGSALTIQTAIGFSLTILSIRIIPIVQQIIGWEYVFMVLAIGPFIGIVAMVLLRNQPDASLIANGRM